MAVRDLIPWSRGRTQVSERGGRDPFVALHGEMNRLFDDFSRSFGLRWRDDDDGGFGWPTVEVKENDKSFTVEVDLPGLDQKDIDLLLSDGGLTIRGEKRSETSDDKRHYTERYYGTFERQIPLTGEIQPDKAKAVFKNGVLRVDIPKTEQAVERSRRIPIQS